MPGTTREPANSHRSLRQRLVNKKCQLTLVVVLLLAALAQAQTFTTLYNFTGGSSDGGDPVAGVVQDPAGDLYGTAFAGGAYGDGVVFKLNTAGAETVLHSFAGLDGQTPTTPVILDKAGNIYGTTEHGGPGLCGGCGVVFKVDTAGNETVLHSFAEGRDSCSPDQGLVRDNAGNLYGTTTRCGSSNKGTIFKIGSEGRFTLLHSFSGYPADGARPFYGHLTVDKSGNLYGVTFYGGVHGRGALYELSKKGTFVLLYSFKGGRKDGCLPYGSVVQDKAGNLYGTTGDCGFNDGGTIWKVSKNGKETILHNFAESTSDGCRPYGGVARDSKGNLYGITYACGANGGGALYELSTSGGLTVLHSFDFSDGADPIGEVLLTAKGILFGTTYAYGGDGYGTVWMYVP